MRGTLTFRIRDSGGSLLRVLGVAVRRGYSLVGLDAADGGAPDTMDVVLTVEGSRPPQRLVKQLEKLLDVENVELSGLVPARRAFQ